MLDSQTMPSVHHGAVQSARIEMSRDHCMVNFMTPSVGDLESGAYALSHLTASQTSLYPAFPFTLRELY